jgi:hypothetical protein
MGEDWTAEQWLQWLRRGPSDPIPSRHGLNDCADALEAFLAEHIKTVAAWKRMGEGK